MTELADRLSEIAPEIDHDGARMYFERTRRDRRRQRRVVSGAVFAAITMGVALIVGSLVMTGDDATTVASTGNGSATVEFLDLSGRAVSVALPQRLAKGFQVREQSAGLHLGSDGWRLDVVRGSEASPTGHNPCESASNAVSGEIGPWKVMFSGDGMTASSCRTLLDELQSFETRDSVLVYDGSGELGPIDSPDVVATTKRARLSLLHRSPTCSQANSKRTSSGLLVERVEYLARGTTLTVLCNHDASIELWIDAAQWPPQQKSMRSRSRAAGGDDDPRKFALTVMYGSRPGWSGS